MDTFTKTLLSLQTGARQAEEVLRVVVKAAVEDALYCVASDFGHDYGKVLEKHLDNVIERHVASRLVQADAKCKGFKKNREPCTKRAQLHGYCRQHAEQQAEEAAKKRKILAYKNSIAPRVGEATMLQYWLKTKTPLAGSTAAYAFAPTRRQDSAALL